MYRNPAKLFTYDLALTSVDASANLNVQPLDCIRNRSPATNCARGSIERRKKTIARCINHGPDNAQAACALQSGVGEEAPSIHGRQSPLLAWWHRQCR